MVGQPAFCLAFLSSEDDWFDYRLAHEPRSLTRIAAARKSRERGKGIELEALSD